MKENLNLDLILMFNNISILLNKLESNITNINMLMKAKEKIVKKAKNIYTL